MLNKVMDFVGTSVGKKVVIGGLAVVTGAIGICLLAKPRGKGDDESVAVDSDEPIDIEGEVTEVDEDDSKEE